MFYLTLLTLFWLNSQYHAVTVAPTVQPTVEPTVEPTVAPTIQPTVEPTVAPTVPTNAPSHAPTVEPGNSPTNCSQQLFNFFVELGLNPNTTVQPVLTYTTGVMMGVPFVKVTFDFQKAARFYQNLISPGNTSNTFIGYESVDVPWCMSNLVIDACLNGTQFGTAKNRECNISDIDLGTPSQLLGRLFLYPSQDIGCNGTFSLTMYNVTLQSGFDTNVYIYDIASYLNQSEPTVQQALNQYRSEPCDFSTGSVSSAIQQGQFTCIGPLIGCNGTRPPANPALQVIPIPEYACVFNNGTYEYIVWQVYSYQPQNYIEGYFGIDGFTASQLLLIQLYEQLDPTHLADQPYILLPGTRRQFMFAGPGFDLTSFVVLFYQNQYNLYNPQYTLSNDPVIEVLPCICGTTIDCQNGTIDLSTVSLTLDLNNILPIPCAGPALFLPLNTMNFTLNSSCSYDPDNAPRPFLTFLWTYWGSVPVGLPVPVISNDTSPTVEVPAAALTEGEYIFILYASDSQALTFISFNVTIMTEQVFAVVVPDYTAVFTPCIASPFSNSTPILLNGSLSYSTNASDNLTYNWSQTDGFSVTPNNPIYDLFFNFLCYMNALLDSSSANAYFIPPLAGLYCFNLTVCSSANPTICSWSSLCINAVPNFTAPQIPPETLMNFTPPPLRTDPPINRVNVSFPNVSFPPFSLHPFPPPGSTPSTETNTTVPPVFPSFPTTSAQWFLIFLALVVAFFVFGLFVLLWVVLWPDAEHAWMTLVTYSHK